MKAKKKLITIIPDAQNISLIKDVGMIPYYMFKENLYDSTISFYKKKEDLPNYSSQLNGLKYLRIHKIFNNEATNLLLFLLRYLFTFDVVILFHPDPYKVLVANIIKLLTFNKIKFYFKMDLDDRIYEQPIGTNSISGKVKKILCDRIDLFSVESEEVRDYLNNNTYYQSVKYIPNGYHIQDSGTATQKKERIFLTVGRLGTHQKNTETLLEAFAQVGEHVDWKLVLVGEVDISFNDYIKAYYEKYPWAYQKVTFTGPIYDRKELMSIYQKSAVFVLSSRYESFGLVFLEAMSQGCYILSTKLSPVKSIIVNNELGRLYAVEAKEELANYMRQIIDDKIIIPDPKDIQDYVKKYYSWSVIVNKMKFYLDNSSIS